MDFINIGVVIIGRNEGAKLDACFRALQKYPQIPTVYVDSDSCDNSIQIAESFGIHTIILDSQKKLTAARGRNAGFEKIYELYPNVEMIQFVDGDAILEHGWIEKSYSLLKENPKIAIAAGDLVEKDYTINFYKRISQMEWFALPGEAQTTGGIFMIKCQAFKAVNGFNSDIAGAEDTELCYRLRQKGWKIWHLNQPMALHDTSMSTFRQFWRRCVRTGYAFSEISHLHGRGPERLFVKENRSTIFYGGILPIGIILLLWPTNGWSLALLILYPLLYWRIYRRVHPQWSNKDARFYAFSCILAKFPGFFGIMKYYYDSFRK